MRAPGRQVHAPRKTLKLGGPGRGCCSLRLGHDLTLVPDKCWYRRHELAAGELTDHRSSILEQQAFQAVKRCASGRRGQRATQHQACHGLLANLDDLRR